ncbi:hypothetical protein J5N97_011809 [Dioscorea zingiberensis]|uniref:Apple domain-containing protein n=1 Tax=Dioscorea zingiberensis TaxID=325984 RepID=A0A9D5HNV4_9LILI|nr:hypothetical protein J5N97_011809 [Dioscorea zingiberensis]
MHDYVFSLTMDKKANLIILPFLRRVAIDCTIEAVDSTMQAVNMHVLRYVPRIWNPLQPAKKWVSGPLFDISGFTNTPELLTLNGFTNWYNISRDEVYYRFGTGNPKSLSRWTANQFGKVERLLWNESISMWTLVLNLPKSQCDEYSPCGPYGLCDLNSSPICSCLQGFRRKSQQELDQRDASSGCVRLTALDCKNRTDRFMTVTHTSLPDTTMAMATFHNKISLDECRQKCLTNCSCTGYASADIYGRGCIIWVSELVGVGTVSYGGREVFVQLASADLGTLIHSLFIRVINYTTTS